MQYGAAIVIRCFTVSQSKTAHVSAGPNVANHAPLRRFSFISSSLSLSLSLSLLFVFFFSSSSSLISHLSILTLSLSHPLSPSLTLSHPRSPSTSLYLTLSTSQSSCSSRPPPLPAYSAPFVGYILTNSHHYDYHHHHHLVSFSFLYYYTRPSWSISLACHSGSSSLSLCRPLIVVTLPPALFLAAPCLRVLSVCVCFHSRVRYTIPTAIPPSLPIPPVSAV